MDQDDLDEFKLVGDIWLKLLGELNSNYSFGKNICSRSHKQQHGKNTVGTSWR